MSTKDRRGFLATALGGVGMALTGCTTTTCPKPDGTDRLDAAAAAPVLKRSYFPDPLLIESVELLHYHNSFICRVRTTSGAEGVSVSNNLRMDYLHPIFLKRVAPFFVGKDVRDLDALIDGVYRYRSNYKFQSYALGVPVATVEFAILDLLGKLARVPLGALIGEIKNPTVDVYLATRFRDRSAEASVASALERIDAYGYRAVKFKIGEKMGANRERIAGRTDRLIPSARAAFADLWLGVDANGGYDVAEAIRIGHLLADHNYGFFEEPVPFDWYRATKEVADALPIPLAGGEQEASQRNFRNMVSNRSLRVLRPDPFYFGGMIRSVRVARMAAVSGATVVPHISGSGLGYLYGLHFISALPNAGAFHPNSRSSEPIPIHCPTSNLAVTDGSVRVPTGPGLGVSIDPDFLAKHQVIG